MRNRLLFTVYRPANDPQLMSYRSYLDSFLLPFEEGRSAEAQQRNCQIKAQRQALKRTFTASGHPGEMFRWDMHAQSYIKGYWEVNVHCSPLLLPEISIRLYCEVYRPTRMST